MGASMRSIMHIEFHHQLTRKMMSSTRFSAHQYYTKRTKCKWLRYTEWNGGDLYEIELMASPTIDIAANILS